MCQPLKGVRVLDLSRLLPGPFATQVLADYGADVIKIEDTRTGDGFRTAAPVVNGMSLRHVALNRNKRCLALNLKSPEGREVFLRLAHDAHVVVEQFRPGVMGRLGLDYETVRSANPRIVYCSLSGFGQEAPHRDLAAHDPNYLSLAGLLGLVGTRNGPPALNGLQVADVTAALFMVSGILIALRRAEREGIGDYLDMALFDCALGVAVTAASTYFATGRPPRRGEERHSGKYPMADVYETADGKYVTIAAIEEPFWRNLCRALRHEEWIDDHYAEGDRAEEIRNEMRSIFRTRTRDEWFAALKTADVCLAPVLDLDEALDSEQAKSRGATIAHDHPIVGPTSILATPIKLASTRPDVRIPAGRLGEHSEELLGELGYSPPDIERLRAQGVIASPRAGSPGPL